MNYYWRRVGAFVIDMSVINMFSEVVYPLFDNVIALTYSNILVDLLKIFINILIFIVVAITYNVVTYKYFKYPLGKLLMGVVVLDLNNERISVKKYFIREYNKYIFIYATLGLYIPYQFLFKLLKKKQTFHDEQVDTQVII